MQASLLAWLLLPCLGGCHWIQRHSIKPGRNTSHGEGPLHLPAQPQHSEPALHSRFSPEAGNASLQPMWRCSPDALWKLIQVATDGPSAGNAGKEADPCVGGFTKLFWATLLSVFALIAICVFVPVMLEITRRRPPGVPLVLCGITFDCCDGLRQKHLIGQPLESPRTDPFGAR
mmetsp:Transcript_21874/g.41195  ORF Transcript_21874/g.41195 Transcript_21874/m.41195 type:complete len:174 (+) Transcript_21874:1-522(+)